MINMNYILILMSGLNKNFHKLFPLPEIIRLLMFVKLILSGKAGHHSLLPHTLQLGDVHNSSLTALQTIYGVLCWQTLNTIKILRAAGSDLIESFNTFVS